VQTAMKYSILTTNIFNGAMLQLTDLWLSGISLSDEEQDSIVN